ncbi:MAG: Exonuclease SbcC, partial [Myxococcaceae bacterium]|nr:Exonuclease SbcC [Myxococcaceae bacterium]
MASNTFSQPPAASAEQASAVRAIEGPVENLRAEIAATTDKPRQARLLSEIGELHERAGDEPGAARDYLGAFNADPAFREPLEGLVRLLERRRSLKNLGRLIDALVRAAVTPEEKVRALTMRAAFLEDVSKDLPAAKASLEEASAIDVPAAEASAVWISIELLAAKMGEPELRVRALGERAARSADPTWRGLLLIDLARMAAGGGDLKKAFELLEEARALEGGATYLAAVATERLAQTIGDQTDPDTVKARADAYAAALEAQAELILGATSDPARGDALGVPRSVRAKAFMADVWLRAADVRRLAGEIGKAATVLDRALAIASSDSEQRRSIALPAITVARMRVAELMGDTQLAAKLAASLLEHEQDGGVAASLAMRVAEQAASEGDASAALAALQKAVAKDPSCLPARALQLDLLADGGDHGAFASQLEAFAELLPTDEAKGRAFLLAAYVWGAQANDVDGAKAALSQTNMYGIPPATSARLARSLASVQGDLGWHEEATRRLLASGTADAEEQQQLGFELVRSRLARGDADGTKKALGELAALGAHGAWIAAALEAFLPDLEKDPALYVHGAETRARAVERLATLEEDPARARGLSLVAAATAHRGGDIAGARARVRTLVERDPADVVLAVYLAGLERASGDHAAAANVLAACGTQTSDPELAAALHLEAAFARWRGGDRETALEAFAQAASTNHVSKTVLAWAARGVQPDALESRRRAIVAGTDSGEDAVWMGLEQFATELAAGETEAALEALAMIEDEAEGDLAIAAALARMVLPEGEGEDGREKVDAALARLAGAGTLPNQIAASEQLRRVRAIDPEAAVEKAQQWFDVGGGAHAGLEWLTATMVTRDFAREADARRGLAALFVGAPSEALEVSAVILDSVRTGRADVPLLSGRSDAVRLANLETTPPGSSPARRGEVLQSLEGALGSDATLDALALSGWSFLAANDSREALEIFEEVAETRPEDLAAWEGLRTAAEMLGDKERHAHAARELGQRCADRSRGAAFCEEAAHLLVALGKPEEAEAAFEESFAKDASRGVAFDKLFRRVRERKDGDKLLFLITRRLERTDDPTELGKLFWEQARVLREKGDHDGALKALENVTMMEPEHVGALALTGEIFIRRGQYEEAATSLATLATIEEAPPKNRVTAGIAAVDLYEN